MSWFRKKEAPKFDMKQLDWSEKPVIPNHEQEKTTSELFEEILERLDTIEKLIGSGPTPTNPHVYPKSNAYACKVCGKLWQGVESYHCSNYNCPIQIKVT